MNEDYELTTSKLLYYPERGFELKPAVADWYARHQTGARLRNVEWETFQDPRAMTYSAYVARRREREARIDTLFERLEAAEAAVLERAVLPLRYPLHGMQMVAAYVAQMAPSGRIAAAALFQAADLMRVIQRLAYRLRLLQLSKPGAGLDSLRIWQSDPAWQPLRETIERLLVTYDWDEAFAALNLAIQPWIDLRLLAGAAAAARAGGEPRFGEILDLLREDAAWQREWSAALCRAAVQAEPQNRVHLRAWVNAWSAAAERATSPLEELLGTSLPARAAVDAFHAEAGL